VSGSRLKGTTSETRHARPNVKDANFIVYKEHMLLQILCGDGAGA
jgi:hypothetical protein